MNCCQPCTAASEVISTMTITQLWPTLLSKAKKKAPTKFKEAIGKTLGVDVSVWLHQSCSLKKTAFCFHAHPRYPPRFLPKWSDITDSWLKMVSNFILCLMALLIRWRKEQRRDDKARGEMLKAGSKFLHHEPGEQ
jgi:hypothetical protein